MSIKERDELRKLIDKIEICDFEFAEHSLKGKIECEDIKESPYLTGEGVKMYRIFIPKTTVSPSQWDKAYNSDNCGSYYNYYNEYTDKVQYFYNWEIDYELDMTETEYKEYKSLLDKVDYIETEAKIMCATFSNIDKANSIKELKLFSSLSDRLYWGVPFKGWTGKIFFDTRFGPLFTERNKILNLIDNLKDFSEVDKENMVKAYKEFLHKELEELEENEKIK